MNLSAFTFLAILISFNLTYGQADSLQQTKDSVHLNDQFDRMRRLSVEKLADSLKRADLEKQVSNLTSGSQRERDLLLLQLQTIENRDSLRKIKQRLQVDSLRKFVKGYPVTPFNDTLFLVFTRQGSFLPKDRAEAVANRVSKLGEEYPFYPDSLNTSNAEQTVDIFYKGLLLVSISEQDALWSNLPANQLAEKWKNAISESVIKYKEASSWRTLLKQISLTILVIVTVALLIHGANKLYRLLLLRTTTAHETWYSKGIKVNNYELLNSIQQLKLIHWIFSVLKWILIILIVYLALPILFGIFPFTRDISNLLIGYILSPLKNIGQGIWNYIPNLITIIVVVVIFRYVLKFLNYIRVEVALGRLTIPGFYQDWANPTYQIIRVLILAFMLVVIFPYMPGSDSGIFKGVSVFIGVLFTFGSAGALGNVVAGLVLTYMRAFKLGDRVKIGDVTGDIIGKTLLVTRVKTIQNEVISIPNSFVMNNHTMNYSSEAQDLGLIIHTTITIGYDVPWRKVHQLLIDAALQTPLVEQMPSPYVLQTSLEDNYVSYSINAFTKEPNRQAIIYSNLHANIQDHFNKAGVEIMSPHYRAWRDGGASTIPNEDEEKKP